MNNKDKKKGLQIFSNIHQRVYQLSLPCMCTGCSEPSINSHLLQKKGILSKVFESGHMYEPRPSNIFQEQFIHNPSELKRVGVEQALSVHTFCKTHDENIFGEIEKCNLELNNYRHCLLLSYRTVCAEARRKECEVEVCKRFLESNTIRQMDNEEQLDYFKENQASFKLGQRDLLYHVSKIEKELEQPEHEYMFYHKEFPISGIYCSTTLSLDNFFDTNSEKPLDLFLLHVIPTENKTHIVLGFDKNNESNWAKSYFQELMAIDDNTIEEYLTSLLIRTNGWGISPSVYEELSRDKIAQFFKLYEEDRDALIPQRYEHFNLFDGVLLETYRNNHSS
jgi:hypothetical protein